MSHSNEADTFSVGLVKESWAWRRKITPKNGGYWLADAKLELSDWTKICKLVVWRTITSNNYFSTNLL